MYDKSQAREILMDVLEGYLNLEEAEEVTDVILERFDEELVFDNGSCFEE